MRNTRIAASVVVLASIASGMGQAVARADSSAITIQWASTDSINNGKFDVSIVSASPVTSISATLHSYATQQNAATVTDFTLTSGTTASGVWETSNRVQLPALGSYRIDLTVTDAAGDAVTEFGTGVFYYFVQTFFKHTGVSTRTVDITNDQVVLSGQLFGRWPASGATAPLADFPVYLADDFAEEIQLTTDANGDFSGVETVTQLDHLQALFQSDNDHIGYGSSISAQFLVRVKQSASKLVLNVSPRKISFGSGTSLSGTLLWDSPTGWQPLANEQVGASGCGLQSVQFLTDANGNFSLPVSGPLEFDCTITVGWQSDDPFKETAAATVDVTVIQPADFSSFTAQRVDSGDVSVAGAMHFPGLATPYPLFVDVQYSKDGKGGWATVAASLNTFLVNGDYSFSAAISSAAAGYWRAIYDGEPHNFTDATSAVVYVPAGS